VLGDDTFRLRTSFEEFLVRLDRFAGPPSPEQAALARRAMFDLRFGVEAGDPRLVATAQEIVSALDGGGSFGVFGLRNVGSSLNDAQFQAQLLRRLEDEFARGRLVVEREQLAPLTERRDEFELQLPPLPPARRESNRRTFEVRFIDEIGKAISGIDAEFTADGAQTRGTNAGGIALLEGVQSSSANVAILDPEALSQVLEPRWESFRPGKPPKESNTTEVVFRGDELGPFDLKAELPNTVVIKPPLGKLFVELWDKAGRVRHAKRTYQITGPQSFEGTTDDAGQLLHEDVFPGDYQLSLALDFFEESDPDRSMDVVDSALVTLEPSDAEPQVRLLGAVPRSILACLEMSFNTNKAFLLPTALPSVRKLRTLYQDNAPCKLLVVGHADTTAGPSYNDKLSLERAEAVISYLKDDVEAWFKLYDQSDAKKRWGKVEDHLMIQSMPGFKDKPKGEDPVRWFQRTHNLDVDGVAGKDTRRALIQEYMSLDGASLKDFVGEIDAVAHGCGENFPLDDSGEELDEAPADNKRDPIDRRVELFFFDPEFGITPPPPGPNSKPGGAEYPLWRSRVAETVTLEPGDPDAVQVHFIELADAHFRTNSAVVLPEGEAPDDKGKHKALSAVGLIAGALRFNDEHEGRTIFVAGHTDTAAGDQLNDELSRQRAALALALLEGDRDTFRKTANKRHKPADINQILSWVTQAFPDIAFNCEPTAINDVVDSGKVTNFQQAFKKAAFSPGAATLGIDGKVGEETWGAFFDCYELGLQRELGEDGPGIAALRSKLKFVDPKRKSLGFGEHFPIEEMGVDEFRSQTNRRVEILFFEAGEEPDLADAEQDPETSELYLPGNFEHQPIGIGENAAEARAIVLEWPDDWTDSLPRDLAIRLVAGTASPIDLRWRAAPIVDDFRRFEFQRTAEGVLTTLSAVSSQGQLVLWQNQPLDNPAIPPAFLATLFDLVTEDATEGSSEDAEELPSAEATLNDQDGGLDDGQAVLA
jgi:outer membrane protein OmpA-like peptidoglycan-associated protein